MRYSFLLLFSMSFFYVFPQEDLLSFFEDDVKENIDFVLSQDKLFSTKTNLFNHLDLSTLKISNNGN